jgi:hypothetical protein
LARELVRRWTSALNTEAEISRTDENIIEFVVRLTDIRLRTMHEVPCLLASGHTRLAEPLREFWGRYNSPHHIPFVLALSEPARAEAEKALNSKRHLILTAQQVKEMAGGKQARALLIKALTQQIPRRTLLPYNFLVPAEGGMFFGRNHELERLRDEDANSFAIAGPGRIGKTSLVKRYKDMMTLARNPRAKSIRYVSFYKSEPLPNKTARLLAMQLDPSSRSNRVEASDLVNFLRYQSTRSFGGPPELLLDEVDEVCLSETFQFLGEAAKLGYCRLVLCGKGVLLKMMLNTKSPLDCRLDLLQLRPLEDDEAVALLAQPLADLGFHIVNLDALSEEVLYLTGRLPNLVQLFAIKLADGAMKAGRGHIAPEHLEALKDDFLIAQFFIKSLTDLDDPQTRLVGMLLVREGRRDFSVAAVQEVARSEGVVLDSRRASDICTDLLVNNVLVWNHGSYSIANGGLIFYAQKKEFLGNALEETRAVIKGVHA